MSHSVDPAKLSFMVFPARFPENKYLSEYQKAYELWRSVWNQALKEEMNVKDELYSDNYSRQSHVAVLFYDGEAAALMTLNHYDLNDPVSMDDSYFKVWPEIARMRLKKEAKQVMSCCNMTVGFNFRRGAYGVCWKTLHFSFLVRYLKSSSIDSIVGTPRLEKSVEKACYRTGAHPIQKDIDYTIPGQRVDLVSWSRDLDEKIIDPELWSLVNYTWKNSTTITDKRFSVEGKKGEKHAA